MRRGSRDGLAVIGLLVTDVFLAGCGGPVRRGGTNDARAVAAAAAATGPAPGAGGAATLSMTVVPGSASSSTSRMRRQSAR